MSMKREKSILLMNCLIKWKRKDEQKIMIRRESFYFCWNLSCSKQASRASSTILNRRKVFCAWKCYASKWEGGRKGKKRKGRRDGGGFIREGTGMLHAPRISNKLSSAHFIIASHKKVSLFPSDFWISRRKFERNCETMKSN